jgi:hypothetical protein
MTTSAGDSSPSPRLERQDDLAFRPIFTLGPRMSRTVGPSAIVLGSVAFSVLSIRGLWGTGMLAFGDLPRFPSDASVFVDSFREAWSDRGFGGPYPSISWFLFLASLLTLTGGDGALAQQLAMTLWIPVAFCGMAYLCRRYVETSWLLAAIGGLLYVVTPISIGLFIGGAVALIWSYALLPTLLLGVEALRRSGMPNLAWLALPAALLAATSPELLAFGLLVAAVWFAIGSGRRAFIVAAGAALGLALVATLPSLVSRGSVGLTSGLIEKMTEDFEYTYAEITPLHLLRLAGNHGDPMDPLGYNDATSWGYTGYGLIAAVAAGLLLRRRGDVFVLRLVALASVVLGALLGIALLARTRPEIFADFPPAFVFRNPGKLMMLLAVALVPAAMYGLRRLFEVYPHRREALRFVVAAGLLTYLIAYAGPALSGDWGVERVRGAAYEADPGLQASAQYLKRQDRDAPGRWRAIWVPFDHTDALNLEWIRPYWANEPNAENRHPAVEETIASLDNALDEIDDRRFHGIADRSAVRYVVLRPGADRDIGRMFARDPQMTRLRVGRGFVVWRNDAALPRIRQYSGLKAVVVPKAQSPVRYRSNAILTLSPDVLAEPRGWTTYGTRGFRRAGDAIRVRATSSEVWPILATRVPAVGNATYLLTARVRTRNAVAAHLKVVWYRGSGDRKHLALDYAAPILTGTNGWTRLSAVVESPRNTRFAEVAFLAGKRSAASTRAAVSWVRDVQLSNIFIGDQPSTRTEALAEVVPDIAARGWEVVDAHALEPETTSTIPGLAIGGVVVNPGFAATTPPALRPLLRARQGTEIISRAEVTLRPRSGDWQRRADAAVVVGQRGSAVVPLGLVPADRYVLALTGCRLRGGTFQIVRSAGVLPQALVGPGRDCGRFTTTRPVALSGRTTLRMSLGRNASVAAVHAFPVRSRGPLAQAASLTVSEAGTTSPRVTDVSSPGVTLADSYHGGWETSGSGGMQLQTFPALNSFLVDEPSSVTGLHFRPQLTRDVLIFLSALAWLAIVVLLAFGRGFTRRLIEARPRERRRAPGSGAETEG